VSLRFRSCPFLVLCFALCVSLARAQIFLPGTQPSEGGIKLDAAQVCSACHAQTANGRYDPYFSWQSGMMSLATKDPVFRAAMAIANQDVKGASEFCLRCHTPRGFLEGRLSPPDGSALAADDLQGVTCVLCHRLVDPRSQEATWLAKSIPPGLGNAMMVVDPADVMRGPYGDNKVTHMRPHQARKSPFLASGDLCGTCHDVSNPMQAADVKTQPPYAFGHIERTYSEWALSEFAKQGPAGACQSCHYPALTGGGYPTRYRDNPKREHFVEHGAVGGSTWVQGVTWKLWNGQDMDRAAIERGKEKARQLLRSAATLELTFPAEGRARLRITNQTGHKLPTGYPEGRRMWVNARFYDGSGKLLRETGRYGEKEDTVFGKTVKLPTLLDPENTRVYECLPAMSEAQAKKYGKSPGPSFFFILNDIIAKDNRIPPKGFTNGAFAERHCEPVGAEYADGQSWDDVNLELPAGTARVEARLMYQSASAEYIKFFAEADKTSEWGRRVYEAWGETGRCAPEMIAEIAREVGVQGK
jgi:hypothetical protein